MSLLPASHQSIEIDDVHTPQTTMSFIWDGQKSSSHIFFSLFIVAWRLEFFRFLSLSLFSHSHYYDTRLRRLHVLHHSFRSIDRSDCCVCVCAWLFHFEIGVKCLLIWSFWWCSQFVLYKLQRNSPPFLFCHHRGHFKWNQTRIGVVGFSHRF